MAPVTTITWCSTCGALVPPGAQECPKCGMPLPTAAQPPHHFAVRDLDLPKIDVEPEDEREDDPDATHVNVPRIESAIPAEPSATSASQVHDRIPHAKVFLVAALVAVAVVGGATLVITHPWNPDAYASAPTQDADLSKMGFPGTVSNLSGQDKDSSQTSDDSQGADSTYESLAADYDSLKVLAGRVDENRATFDSIATSGSLSERRAASSEAQSISLDVSNLISDIQGLDDAAGIYADDKDHLLTLANWLRNRTDTLTRGWQASVSSSNPSADAEKIRSYVESGTSDYKTLFDQNYESWKPEQKN